MLHTQNASNSYQSPCVQDTNSLAYKEISTGKKSIRAVARHYKTPKSTLHDHVTGRHKPAKEAHAQLRLLTPEQEEVAVTWMQFLGMVGRPLTKKTLIPKIKQLCGRVPGQNWLKRFTQRHKAAIKVRKALGLDPKRAQAFNFQAVNDFFRMVDIFLKKRDIPWSNVYNIDEKGIQIGGGQKGSGEKYFFSRKEIHNYMFSDPNRELITVIENCCADGTALLPAFVFSGQVVDNENLEVDDNIW